MEKETIKKIFNFLEKKDNKNKPIKWKLLNDEPITKDDLIVKGDLDLNRSEIRTLPIGLRVKGDLDLSHSEIETLPKGLKVGGSLYLRGSKIRSLPEGLKVGNYLDLSRCVSLTSLPEGLKVGGDLDIGYTNLEKYTDKELRDMVKPGFIKGDIDR
jgi:hypothetical protein